MTHTAPAATRYVLGLGSNLGSREGLLRAAVDLLAAARGVTLTGVSRVWQTAPVGSGGGGDYFNAAVRVETALTPEALLAKTAAIEHALGRERGERWAPRTLDIDLLLADPPVIRASAALTLPHRELLARPFALAPLLELVPAARDARTGVVLADVLAALGPPSAAAPWVLGERTAVVHAAHDVLAVCARDRAEAFAAAAEALGAATVDPDTVAPARVIAVCAEPASAPTDAARLFAWLSCVLEHATTRGFALRRVVVFSAEPDGPVRGALVGEPQDPQRHAVKAAVRAIAGDALGAGPDATGAYHARIALRV